jgi:excisionase family DNA binding protein
VALSAIDRPPPPRVALSIEEACASLGVSWDLWRSHIEPEIRLVRVGRRKLVPLAELERWVEAHAERVL